MPHELGHPAPLRQAVVADPPYITFRTSVSRIDISKNTQKEDWL